MPRIFIQVPDFKEQVAKEPKPKSYDRLSDEKREEYDRDLVQIRMMMWACHTAATACNWVIVMGLLFVVMFTPQFIALLGAVIQGFKRNYLGI